MTFTIGRRYRNRRGEYEVLDIDGDTLRIRYDDGTEQQASALVQERIANNLAIEAVNVSPYPEALQERNNIYFSTIGFLAERTTMLEAIVPPHSLGGFIHDYAQIKGTEPRREQQGFYIHRPGTDKWGCELRATFQAEYEELSNLDFGPDVHYVIDPMNQGHSWRINNNHFWWQLIRFGFEMGALQNSNIIRSHLPSSYRVYFDSGQG